MTAAKIVHVCGDCARFKRGNGLSWQYCPVCKGEVSSKCKACVNFKPKE